MTGEEERSTTNPEEKRQKQTQKRQLGDCSAHVSTIPLQAVMKRVSQQATQYEDQMRDLESKLSENLSNFRAVDSLTQEAFLNIKPSLKRGERAQKVQVPNITNELDQSLETLSKLSSALPKIQSKVTDIQQVYNSGQKKAGILVENLVWLNTDFYERWRLTIFTSSSPVSPRWKAIMRFLFTISFILCSYLFWIALSGAYRAHRHRLVWGDRLMS